MVCCGMRCPFCAKGDTRVIDTRETAEADVTRRRRECLDCEKRFTTYERGEGVELVVVKKDNTRQQFDRQKLLSGLVKACEKRPIPIDRLQEVADEIETFVRGRFGPEVQSKEIGSVVMDRLKRLDKVAYIRFASVYREFQDVESFQREVNQLLKAKQD